MKTKIGTSFGLAFLVAIGVIATMLALGMFTAPKANAEVTVTAVTNTPSTPGSTSSYTITFTTVVNANSPLTKGETITVTFDKNFSVPAAISKESIVITTVQSTGGSSNPTIDPSVSTCTSSNDSGCSGAGDTQVVLTIGDTHPSDASQEDMQPAAGHKLTFSPLAGIINPSSPGGVANTVNNAHWIRVVTSDDAGNVEAITNANSVAIVRTLVLSTTFGTRGSSLTLTGSGYSIGTATVYLDNGDGTGTADDGIRSGSEPIITTAAISGGGFSATMTVDARFGTGGPTLCP